MVISAGAFIRINMVCEYLVSSELQGKAVCSGRGMQKPC